MKNSLYLLPLIRQKFLVTAVKHISLCGISVLCFAFVGGLYGKAVSLLLSKYHVNGCNTLINLTSTSVDNVPLKKKWEELHMVCLCFRYLESCSIPLLKRKCKSSTNTSSSSSEGDKKNQQRLQEIKALGGNGKDPGNCNGKTMICFFLICYCCMFQGFLSFFTLLPHK